MLTQAKSSPDMVNYLTYIFSNGQMLQSLNLSAPNVDLVRSSAALNLKNTIKTSYKDIPESSRAYIRASVLGCLEDSNPQIRNFAGTVITETVLRGGVLGWPEVLPELLAIAGNDRGNISSAAQEGAMSALAKVCEDSRKELDREYEGSRPLNFIIPRLLEITSSTIAKVRALALASINSFILQKPEALLASLDAILARLFQLANDQSDDVRRNVCRSLVLIVDIRPDTVQPHMAGLVDYMAAQQRNTDDPDLALEAAEFWLAISENDKMCATLDPCLDKIVPVLLESMVYDEEAVMRLEGGEDDAEVEDRAENIKPRFVNSKTSKAVSSIRELTNGQDYEQLNFTSGDDDGDQSEGEIVEEDEDRGAEVEEQWNLRKCSAAALDVLASTFHASVFNIALPYLKENLRHQEWPNREAAVLAIGAVAEGCMGAITPHLPELVPYLVFLLGDDEPAVRVITCWALGRYSGWASHLESPAGKKAFFEPMMEGILYRMLDKNKRVQESAASAFANLEERAAKELTPYCLPIIRQFVQCFERYKDKNMFILYDCVQTLAEHVGPPLRRPELINLLMPAIIERWGRVSDESQELFPLLECLSYVATALSDAFAPFAIPIFTRCIRIIHQNLEQYLLAVHNEPMNTPDKDFLVTSLDLLSAIIQALEPAKSEELVGSSQPRFFDLLMFCMEDPSNDVRQSSYALLGDCAVNIFPQLHPFLPPLMAVLIRQLDLENLRDDHADTGFSVINNACWSCGEIAMKYKRGMTPFVEQIYRNLMSIITNPQVPISVSENAVIALGRMGVDNAQVLAPHLGEFAKPFLHIIDPVEINDEKGHAFLGLNRTIETNPEAMEDCLLEYFKASVSYNKEDYIPSHGDETIGGSFQRV
jgi:transportin-1